ncbi:hypothetical protein BKA70DRAFT_1230568 [Coprinopsis sp. MPI-PUGE-AT-0042]|nr:hypothetical protein BKA70DRAFT_1230568 [Coprinopsis sp. MPI-PUGE-AT-0042]
MYGSGPGRSHDGRLAVSQDELWGHAGHREELAATGSIVQYDTSLDAGQAIPDKELSMATSFRATCRNQPSEDPGPLARLAGRSLKSYTSRMFAQRKCLQSAQFPGFVAQNGPAIERTFSVASTYPRAHIFGPRVGLAHIYPSADELLQEVVKYL